MSFIFCWVWLWLDAGLRFFAYDKCMKKCKLQQLIWLAKYPDKLQENIWTFINTPSLMYFDMHTGFITTYLPLTYVRERVTWEEFFGNRAQTQVQALVFGLGSRGTCLDYSWNFFLTVNHVNGSNNYTKPFFYLSLLSIVIVRNCKNCTTFHIRLSISEKTICLFGIFNAGGHPLLVV